MNVKISTKEEIADAKKGVALHVALLQRAGLKLADARAKAWIDGPKGLEDLLLPLKG